MSIRGRIDTFLSQFEREFDTHNLIEVSRSALTHNLGLFAGLTGLSGQRVIPVLKGNAYGHGIEEVAIALKQHPLDYIAVDGYFEALRVRAVSHQPVLVMGKILPQNFAHMRTAGIAFVVDDDSSIEALAATHRPVKVHLEINSGMNRYGALPTEVERLTKLILSYPTLELEGVMSHLADSDGSDPESTVIPTYIFDAAVETIRSLGANPNIIHLAQSAGSLKAKSKYANSIRLGLGLYGLNPFPAGHELHGQLKSGLRPALKLTSTITKIHQLSAGDKVSYNYTFTAPTAMHIGVLPLGYFEGVNRGLSNIGMTNIGRAPAPIVGRVCMNHTMISLDDAPSAKVGDRVTVYSSNSRDPNSLDSIAAKFNLFNYNLLTALSPDIRRRLVK